LNENITSAAKKTDTTLYGIQIALDQASRSLDNFVYRKCKEGTEAAKEVEAVALVSEMRLILASIATNISQSRMENVYQAMNIPGKPKQLAVNAENPFFGQELLDKAISTIKPVKKARLRNPFQIRQQYGPYRSPSSSTTTAQTIQSGQTSDNPTYTSGWGPPHNVQESLGATHGQLVAPTTDKSSSPVQEEAESGSQPGTDRGNNLPIIQESNRGGRSIKPGALQPTPLYPQEDRAAEASLGYKKPIQVCSGKELQDGVSQLYLQVNQFHLEWPTVLVQSTAIRPITLAAHLYQGATASTLLAIYYRGPEQDHETWAPGKLRQVGDSADTNDKSPDNAQGTGELHWKSSSYVCGSANRSLYAEATPRAQELRSQELRSQELRSQELRSQELRSQDNDFIEIYDPFDEISGPKPSILERPVGRMELPVLHPRDTRDGGLHRCQQHGMGGSFRLQFLLWVIESITGVDAYQRQGTIDNIVRTRAPECC
ncbi:hypothetical protein AYI69_g6174, partial [Smittium culicis]